MPNNRELISVVLPVYNGMEYIDDCINSLIKQTYDNIEILIVNDGSTDGTKNLLEKYSKIDKRIKIINNSSNIGITKSLNLAINKCKGDLIVRQDIDEISSFNRIELQIQYLNRNNLILLGTNCLNIYRQKLV